MHVTIMKIKNHKIFSMHITNSSYYFLRNIIIRLRYFLKYILSLIYHTFILLSSVFYYCVVTKQINSNKYYIITFCIPSNIYSYSYVIINTV